jgi:predicted ATPase/class 3 adenylate cyclase
MLTATDRRLEVVAPSGDVTLMFTDIEGSTKGWDTYQEDFRAALGVHNSLIRRAIADHGGYEVKTIGDSFMVAFGDPLSAALCALDIQRLLGNTSFETVGELRVRIGLHSGAIEPREGDYFGPTVNHAARIEGAGHGGQVVLSDETAERIRGKLRPGLSLADEGLHRLRDLGSPIRLFLLTDDELPQRQYPPLRTLNMLPHNFPAQVTSFVGREREKEELQALLVERKTRLVTLTGPGGTGKTRLSMQVAAEAVQEYRDGIWLIELASLTDAREVPAALALALKIPIVGDTGIPAQVFAYLQDKTALLVIDNFEQVVDAARFVGDLLKQCRGIACLVTSQHLLQIAGEVEYPLSPLSVPSPGATLAECFGNPTVQLFAERAQAAKPAFELNEENVGDVVEICRRLEGLPLAIELTAALVRAMSPQQILPRLQDRYKLLASTRRDLDPRQRSLRGALDWSYELLTEEERALFGELSVFSGGFFVEDVEAVCTSPDSFLFVVVLRDKSLLRMEEVNGEARFLMLETLRGYAAEKLEQSGAAAELRERHAKRFLEQARVWNAALNSSGEAMQRMIREIDNLRAGMDWACDEQRDDLVVGYGESLGRFYTARGLYEEGDRRLVASEDAARQTDKPSSLAQILLLRGRIATQSGRNTDAKNRYEESYVVSERAGDRARMVAALVNLGTTAWIERDFDVAQKSWQEGLVLARETQHPTYEATLLSNLSTLAWELDDRDTAIRYIEDGLALHRRQDDRRLLAYALMNYAEVLHLRHEYCEALIPVKEAQELSEEIGDRLGKARALLLSGKVLLGNGEYRQAEAHLLEGTTIGRELGDKQTEAQGTADLARLWFRRGERDRARCAIGQSVQVALGCRDTRLMGNLIRVFAEFLDADGRSPEAAVWTSALADPRLKRDPGYLASVLERLDMEIGGQALARR